MRRRVRIGKAFDLSVSVDASSGTEKPKQKDTSTRRVRVGEEFDAKISFHDAVTRSRIVWVVFAVIAVFLFGAAGLGVMKGEFSALQGVWAVAGPVYGVIAGYFFSRHHKK